MCVLGGREAGSMVRLCVCVGTGGGRIYGEIMCVCWEGGRQDLW